MPKTHATIFVSEALTELFHDSPVKFINLLSVDGNKFLRFYWDQVGSRLPAEQRAASFGLNYDVRRLSSNLTVILITLPPPQVEGEAYYAALVFRPLRRTPFLGINDTTKVIALERTVGEGGQPCTRLVEWDRKLELEVLGDGPEPKLEEFYRAVRRLAPGEV